MTKRKPVRTRVRCSVRDGVIVQDDTVRAKGYTLSSHSPLPTDAERVMRFILRFHDANGFAPTQQEMLNALGMRSNSLLEIRLLVLEREGYIRRSSGARAMAILKRVE